MKFCTACGTEYDDAVLFCQRDGTPLRPVAATADLVGQVIADRYLVQRKLGEGGMGQVYLAEHVKMGRRCAIKLMAPGTMNDPEAVSRFNREAANASRINHPNVCQIYDFGETADGLIYLAMEYIEGRSLTDLLEETRTLALPRAAAIIAQCGDALQAAHDLGIVHRDLKPDNIMVVTARGKDAVKVVDFGIAKAMGAEGSAQKVTKTGFVVGTPEYMSPEQLAGDPVDGRTDIYSLALVFYRAVTGRLPFEADTAQETMIKRLTDDPIPLSAARPDLRFPPGLQQVLDRALARSPEARYTSAAEFGQDVLRVAGTAVVGAADPEAGTQVVPSGARAETVPETRVDPAIAAALRKKAELKGQAAPAGRRVPVVPIAVALVLAAGAGGLVVFRERIFGGGSPAGGGSPTQAPGQAGALPDTGARRVSSASDTGRVQGRPQDRPSGTEVASPPRAADPRAGAGPAPAGGGDRAPARPRKVTVPLPEPEALDDPGRRAAAMRQAEEVYGRADVDDSTRAAAAAYLASAYVQARQLALARDWTDKAIALMPDREGYQNLRQRIADLMGN
jgi:serine/threonine-protein kinase